MALNVLTVPINSGVPVRSSYLVWSLQS